MLYDGGGSVVLCSFDFTICDFAIFRGVKLFVDFAIPRDRKLDLRFLDS
jgi:hypothetical protein